jgi:hypothetical protein
MSYRAKKILTVILFLFFGLIIFSKSMGALFDNDAMKLITQHKEKIDTIGVKHKSYVTRKIDEARKRFDELSDGMRQYKYNSQIRDDKDFWETKRLGDLKYKDLRNQYLNIFRREEQKLGKIKKTLVEKGIAETDFIKDEGYRRDIVYAFEQIGFMFSTHNVKFFTDCDYFGRGKADGSYEPCNDYRNHKSKQYFDDEDVVKKLNYIDQLKKELGDTFLISDERERVNKITVLHNNISSVYFTEIEEDDEIRIARYATENAAKELIPYKGFIFEILNVQRKISKNEAEKYLRNLIFDRCLAEQYDRHGDNKDYHERLKYCKEVTRKGDIHYNNYKPHKYYRLDDYVVGKTLIKFLESYKDFGVNENE